MKYIKILLVLSCFITCLSCGGGMKNILFNDEWADKAIIERIAKDQWNGPKKNFILIALENRDVDPTEFFNVTDAISLDNASNAYDLDLVQYEIDFLAFINACYRSNSVKESYIDWLDEHSYPERYYDEIIQDLPLKIHALAEIRTDSKGNVISCSLKYYNTSLSKVLEYKDNNYFAY